MYVLKRMRDKLQFVTRALRDQLTEVGDKN
jgi:hypothetical protein